MGHSAYTRGSALIAMQIEADYKNSICGQADSKAELTRILERIEELDVYSREAQSFFIDVTTEPYLGGMVSGYIRARYEKKQHLKKMNVMLAECAHAHAQWLDSDTSEPLKHLQACRRKAKSWFELITYLNPPPSFVLPFKTPKQ